MYLLIDSATDRPFYVGKGLGNRCFAHLHEARTTTADTKGDYAKLATIRDIEHDGGTVTIDILRHGLTEAEAYAVEAATIDVLGMTDLANRVVGSGTSTVGRMGVDDINAKFAAKPIKIGEPVILIRVSRAFERGMSDADLYEITRGWWTVSKPRAEKAKLAMAIYGGVVRAVYRIDHWEGPTPELIAENATREGRWGFVGERDPVMEDRYLYGDVTAYLPASAQNPIRYINC